MAEHREGGVPNSTAASGPRITVGRSSDGRGAHLTSSRRTLQLAEAQSGVVLDAGTYLQRSGVSLFLKVLMVASAVILGLFVNLLMELGSAPGVPDGGGLSPLTDGDTLRDIRVAAHYRALGEISLAHRDAAWTHFMFGIKEVVVTVFFPLLTGILGYIFGTSQIAGAPSAGETRG